MKFLMMAGNYFKLVCLFPAWSPVTEELQGKGVVQTAHPRRYRSNKDMSANQISLEIILKHFFQGFGRMNTGPRRKRRTLMRLLRM